MYSYHALMLLADAHREDLLRAGPAPPTPRRAEARAGLALST